MTRTIYGTLLPWPAASWFNASRIFGVIQITFAPKP
jgi:hypothetical protein